MAERETIYTPANGLSAARLLSALPCVYAVAVSNWRVAAAAFFFAVATDMADGPLARRRGEASRVGGLIDHSADALFCIAVLGALAWTGLYPALLPFLIAGAFAQYVADSRVLAGQKLRTSRIGRYNGIAYFVLAGIPIVREIAFGWSSPSDALLLGAGWILAAIDNHVSMVDRAAGAHSRKTASERGCRRVTRGSLLGTRVVRRILARWQGPLCRACHFGKSTAGVDSCPSIAEISKPLSNTLGARLEQKTCRMINRKRSTAWVKRLGGSVRPELPA